jgi:UDP-N-acetylmuramyl-tripeptide synthetase
MLRILRKIIPDWIFNKAQPIYHYLLALAGAIICRFPSKKIKIVGITGTKGKTSCAEIVNTILETAGYKTALGGTLRFKIGDNSKPNLFKMTMPGRFFIQKFIRDAVSAKCDWIVLEMTSEGVKQFRHKFIDLDALIVTNISPEHIESHGSFEKYLEAKLELAHSLAHSSKPKKVIVTNKDDEHSGKFIMVAGNAESYPFSLKDAEPYEVKDGGVTVTFRGQTINSPLRGLFNIQNILAGAVFAESVGIPPKIVAEALKKLNQIRGRVEFVTLNDSRSTPQNFDVVVDYAHTIDSLTKLYETFPNQKKICVLGNTGGGRDKWKRKGMAEVADKFCDEIILTNEDPYDEDPTEILNQMKEGVKNKPLEIIMDRREAINTALRRASLAQDGNKNNRVVLITGKGTDPYIMGPNGTKAPWDDAEVVREELEKVLL